MIHFLGTPKIETTRLILRKLVKKDVQSIYDNWLSDERVSNNRISPPHKTVMETIQRVEEIECEYESNEKCYWGIELKCTGSLIGEIDLYNFDDTTGNCEVSYSIGYNWWNMGFGTEALQAVVEFGFKYMNIHKISAAHNTDNPASGRVMCKVGMELEGIIRHMIRNYKNQYKDCAVYGMIKDDYLKSSYSTTNCILKLAYYN